MDQRNTRPARLTYMRTGPGLPTLLHQREILRGIESVSEWHDAPQRKKRNPDPPQRDMMLKGIHPGDEVWIAFPGAWGGTEDEILAGLELLTRHGGVLRIVGDETVYSFHPDAEPALRLFRRMAKDAREQQIAPALEGARRRRKAGMDRPALKAAWAKAEQMWPDLQYTVAQIERDTGLSSATLYRRQREGKLPQRNAAPFVGGPGAIKRRGKR